MSSGSVLQVCLRAKMHLRWWLGAVGMLRCYRA